MADLETKEIQLKDKSELMSPMEQLRSGLTFKPDVDIFETDTAITLLADMPGVKAEDLTIDLRENVLTLDGEAKPPESGDEVDVFYEYRTGKYYRQFNLSEMIDQAKISAELKDGVLRLNLPKAKAKQPRKIQVKGV